MIEDIRLSLSFRYHRKRKKLKSKLGAEGVLALIDLWLATAEERPDGILNGYDIEDIEMDAGWSGEPGDFVKSLIDCKFLKIDNGIYCLYNWDARQSWVASAPSRGDKARFSRMAKTHRKLYEKLKDDGVDSITKKEFLWLTNTKTSLTDINETLTNGKRDERDTLTPAPAPAPSPSPAPSPDPTPVVNTSLVDKNPEISQNQTAIFLTQLMYDLIKKNNPNFKNPNLVKWAEEMGRIIRIDNRNPTDLEKIIIWCQKDDFWKTNILSPKKLRKQYDQLWIKMQKTGCAGMSRREQENRKACEEFINE